MPDVWLQLLAGALCGWPAVMVSVVLASTVGGPCCSSAAMFAGCSSMLSLIAASVLQKRSIV